MQKIIEYFTPMLFTVATTSHMSCTDVFADQWMPLVIKPALEQDGVYKPLETIERIIDINWKSYGLCKTCTEEKRAEWRVDQDDIWAKIDSWL